MNYNPYKLKVGDYAILHRHLQTPIEVTVFSFIPDQSYACVIETRTGSGYRIVTTNRLSPRNTIQIKP